MRQFLGDAGVPGGGSDYLYTGIDPTMPQQTAADAELPTVQITGHAANPWPLLLALLAGAWFLKG